MFKMDRCFIDEVYVVGFVFCYKVLKRRLCALDLFLELFIKDLEDSFIEGNKVNYVIEINGCNVVEIIVCCMFLLWIGDYFV